ncbi:MAG TPA: hypothetical protein VN829_09380 [Dongiaceae bacterium]|nr:hypothetical protein [Dongiaceae bacterium]
MTNMTIFWIISLSITLLAGGFLLRTAMAAAPVYGADEQPIRVPHYEPLDNDILLEAIAFTENWDGESTGAAGERGPWQMLLSTWKNYSTEWMPYTSTSWKKPEPQRVLHAHASWIRDQMERRKLPQTAYVFALFWKSGYGRVVNNYERSSDKAYAQRAQNLYTELVK